MSRKSFVPAVLTILLAASLLAACGDATNTASPVTTAAGAAAPTVAPTTAAPAPTTAAAPAATTASSGGTTAAAAASLSTEAAAGKKVVEATCQGCHMQAGTATGGRGPVWVGTTRNEAYIRNIVRTGKAPMPAYPTTRISDADLDNIVAYIKSLNGGKLPG